MSNQSNQSINVDVPAEQLMGLVRKVVQRYAAKGSIPKREIEDAEMTVFEKFWNNREKIFGAFQGKSQLTTYCIAVANRMCCEFIRKEKKHWNQLHEAMETVTERSTETNKLPQYETEKLTLFKNEVQRLKNAFQFFNGESSKINLFLKYYLDIPVHPADVNSYHKGDPESVLSLLSQNSGQASKGEKFEKLADVVNLVEGKSVKSDAVRMWLHSRMDALLTRLNGSGIASYNHESLSVLMEMMNNNIRNRN